ncbi:hypothetical protein ACIBQ2_23990 [Micromonospora sediminimaris]|uniref:hypothetical protein n=1 Tax=Micromonospora sediminimaris TaxID=547162 RepID=UPI00379FFB7A
MACGAEGVDRFFPAERQLLAGRGQLLGGRLTGQSSDADLDVDKQFRVPDRGDGGRLTGTSAVQLPL